MNLLLAAIYSSSVWYYHQVLTQPNYTIKQYQANSRIPNRCPLLRFI